MNTTSVSSTIKLNLSGGILENSRSEARRIGISLQDFIRMLMATYFSRSEAIQTISRDQILLKQARDEIESSQYTAVSDSKALKNYLHKIAKN